MNIVPKGVFSGLDGNSYKEEHPQIRSALDWLFFYLSSFRYQLLLGDRLEDTHHKLLIGR